MFRKENGLRRLSVGLAGGREVKPSGEKAAAGEGGTRTPGVGALARRSREEAEESER